MKHTFNNRSNTATITKLTVVTLVTMITTSYKLSATQIFLPPMTELVIQAIYDTANGINSDGVEILGASICKEYPRLPYASTIIALKKSILGMGGELNPNIYMDLGTFLTVSKFASTIDYAASSFFPKIYDPSKADPNLTLFRHNTNNPKTTIHRIFITDTEPNDSEIIIANKILTHTYMHQMSTIESISYLFHQIDDYIHDTETEWMPDDMDRLILGQPLEREAIWRYLILNGETGKKTIVKALNSIDIHDDFPKKINELNEQFKAKNTTPTLISTFSMKPPKSQKKVRFSPSVMRVLTTSQRNAQSVRRRIELPNQPPPLHIASPTKTLADTQKLNLESFQKPAQEEHADTDPKTTTVNDISKSPDPETTQEKEHK
jgi:hypothetical protein